MKNLEKLTTNDRNERNDQDKIPSKSGNTY